MKVCSSCKATYSDWIDFCFEDGAVLAVHSQAQPADEAIDAPMPRHLRAQEAQDTPLPKAGGRRRSLIGGAARENTGSPMDLPKPAVEDSILDVPPPPPTEAPAGPAQGTAAPMPSAWTGADIAARHAAPAMPQPEPLRPVDVPLRQPAQKPAPAAPAPVAQAPAPAAPLPAAPPEPARPPVVAQQAAPTPEPAGFAAAPSASTRDDDDDQVKPAAGRPLVLLIGVGLVGLLVVGGIGALVIVGLGVGGLTLTGGSSKDPSTAATPRVSTPAVAAVAAPSVNPEVVVEAPPTPPVPEDAVAVVDPPVAVSDPVVPTPVPAEVRPEVKATVVAPAVVDPVVPVTTAVMASAQQFGLTFDGTPPGATVSVNGENKGQTPLTIQVPSGDYRIEVAKGGYSAEKRLVSVRAAAQTVKYELWEETRVGKVFVAFAGRDGQTLLVDGLPMGTLPASVDLTEGTHTFAVANPDGTQFSVSKDVVFNAAGRATVAQ